MAPEISANSRFWKTYNSETQEYNLSRSCKYDPTPGEPAPPSEGNLPPCLTVWISVRKTRSGELVGKISIWASRDTWNNIAHLNNEADADKQLQRAANSARDGIWDIEPLSSMSKEGFEEIRRQIDDYESRGSEISGELPLQ